MRIDKFPTEEEGFRVIGGRFFGQNLFLITPNNISCKFTQKTKIFRSSVWDEDGFLVSAGFPKFYDIGQNEENFPAPKTLNNTNIVEKIDGSLLVITNVNGNIMVRTRGTFNAEGLENGYEINILRNKYPKVFDEKYIAEGFSYLYEWVSPNNVIVLNYGSEPDIYLIGMVNLHDYSLINQEELDKAALSYSVKRPKRYSFDKVGDLVKFVKENKTIEGCCIYSNNDQDIHRTKSDWYLFIHKEKENFSLSSLVKIFVESGCPEYGLFYNKIKYTFGDSIANNFIGDISKVCDAYNEVLRITEGMNKFLLRIANLSTRKEKALEILSSYGKTNRSGMLFKLLDGKKLDNSDIEKLLFQVLK